MAHALISLLLCPPAPAPDLTARYEACLRALETATMGGWTRVRFLALISHRLAGESDRLPADFVSDTVWTLSHDWRHRERRYPQDDRTLVFLLAVACRMLARDADEQLAVAVAGLLGLAPEILVSDFGIGRDAQVQTPLGPRAVLTQLFRRVEEFTESTERDFSCLWLLQTAVALDQREWCNVYAPRLLKLMGAARAAELLPSEQQYVNGPQGGALDE